MPPRERRTGRWAGAAAAVRAAHGSQPCAADCGWPLHPAAADGGYGHHPTCATPKEGRA